MTAQVNPIPRAPAYSLSLYDALIEFGLPMRASVLDLACGEGDASTPLAENDFAVVGVDNDAAAIESARAAHPRATWRLADALALPFEPATFDAVICAQSFHLFDRARALAETIRVTKPRGLIAIWWKHGMSGSPLRPLCDEAAREFGIEPLAGTLTGGFREFYSAELDEQRLRVLPWRLLTSRAAFLREERVRLKHAGLPESTIAGYSEALERLISEQLGPERGSFEHAYMQYLYLGRRRA
ncbi:MAG TPA: class I SAM-dependent methyltransferase [Candidatus Dormibacteraeota bacterium]|nr:class I SAM-dependent methyltransferase [Candidatus Dormibacteraeota bacterium]